MTGRKNVALTNKELVWATTVWVVQDPALTSF